MRQNLLYFCLSCFALGVNFQFLHSQYLLVDYPCNPQLVIHEKFDTVQQAFVPEWRYSYHYDVNGVLEGYEKDLWNNGAYELENRVTFTYPSMDTLTLIEEWNGTGYDVLARLSVRYDSLGDKVGTYEEQFQSNNVWDTTLSIDNKFTYDSQGREISMEMEVYLPSLYFKDLREYVYGASGTPDSVFWYQEVGSTWEPTFRWVDITWHSFPDRQAAMYTEQGFAGAGIFVNSSRQTYTYSGVSVSHDRVVENWMGGNWELNSRFLREYDAEGRPLYFNNYFWTNNGWDSYSSDSLNHSVDGQNCLSEILQTSITALTEDLYRVRLSNNFVNVPEPDPILNFELFPNPAQDQVFLKWDAGKAGNAIIELYDLKGQQQLSKVVSAVLGEIRLDLPETLTSGVYILHLRIADQFVVRKLVIN